MSVDLRPLIPAMIVAGTALAVLLLQAFSPREQARGAGLSVAGIVAALASVLWLARTDAVGAHVGGSVVLDTYSLFLHVVLLGIALLVVLLSPAYLRAVEMRRGEYYALGLFSLVGMLGLTGVVDLIALFMALEVMSVSLYALAGMRRDRRESQEAAVKYFVTGAFASAFLLYGIAMLYGVSGSTSLRKIAAAVAQAPPEQSTLALLGAVLLLVGFGFKLASVPFHMWAPDVYEGAPTTVSALMSAGVKVAALGAALRVLFVALPALAEHWQPAVAVLAVVSMVGGNLGALAQSSVKRMLAFSSVAHAGYLLTAFLAAPRAAGEAALFYLAAYAAVNLGGFGALAALARDGREPVTYGDLAGLGQRRPTLAAMLTVFMVSLTGIPVSAGFVGKFYLFAAAVQSGYVAVAIVGVLMSVVSAYYYLGVVVAMYMREPEAEAPEWAPLSTGGRLALGACAALVLVLGVYPAPVLVLAREAARALAG